MGHREAPPGPVLKKFGGSGSKHMLGLVGLPQVPTSRWASFLDMAGYEGEVPAKVPELKSTKQLRRGFGIYVATGVFAYLTR